MTISFLSNSINDMPGCTWSTTSGTFDSAYVAGSGRIVSPYSGARPCTFSHDTDLSGQSIVSFHFDYYAPTTVSSSSDGEWLRWSTPSGVLKMYMDYSNGFMGIRVYDGAGGYTSSAFAYAFPVNTLVTVDLVYEDDGVNVTGTMYVNEVSVLTVTRSASGAAVMPQVVLLTHTDIYNSGGNAHYSQLIFTHGETTVGMKLERLDANAIGFHQDMSTTITEINDDDRGTGWSSGVNTDKNSYTLPTYTVPVGRLIHSLNAQSTVRIGTTGPVNVRPFLRISSTDYDSAADFTPSQHQFGKSNASWVVDPATTVAWTAAGVSATEVGFQVKT